MKLRFLGDIDMLPVVQSALKHEWKVEIWSYESVLHNDYRREKKIRGDLMSIHFIDHIFDRITYQKYDWTYALRDVPRERSIVCRYVALILILWFNAASFDTNVIL